MKQPADPMHHRLHRIARHVPTVEEPGMDRFGGEAVEGDRHEQGGADIDDVVSNLLAHA